MCHFQKTENRKFRKNGWHYEKTKVIFGLSTPKHQDKKNLLPTVIYANFLHAQWQLRHAI